MAFRQTRLSFRQKQTIRRAVLVTLGLAAGPLIGAVVAHWSSGPKAIADGDGTLPSPVYVKYSAPSLDAIAPGRTVASSPSESTWQATEFATPVGRRTAEFGDRSTIASAQVSKIHTFLPAHAEPADAAPVATVVRAEPLLKTQPADNRGSRQLLVASSMMPAPGPLVPSMAMPATHAGIFASTQSIPSAPLVPTMLADEFDSQPLRPIVEAGPKEFLPPPAIFDPPIPTDSPIMRGLGSGKEDSWIDKSGLVVGAYVQGGFTYNPSRTGGDLTFGRVFDESFANAPQLDQLEVSVTRVAARDKFDIGGKLELIYGYDTARFHANGLNAYGGCDDENPTLADRQRHDPRNQIDLTQAYLDMNLVVGNGLLVRAGKFVTPLGYETIDPTTTPFYSRSYLFGFAKPFTHTGLLVNYRFDEEFEIWGGVVRGWDQAVADSNNSVSVLGRFDWRPDPRINVRTGFTWGREAEQCDCGCADMDSSRVLIDIVTTYAATDDLTLGAEGLYGRSGGADSTNRSAEWFGFAGYSSYYLTPEVDLNGRVEWFRDGDGTRLQTGSTIEMTSVTVGLSIRPFKTSRTLSGLRIQPEVRYDHANKEEFDGGTRKNQFTLGLGLLYSF